MTTTMMTSISWCFVLVSCLSRQGASSIVNKYDSFFNSLLPTGSLEDAQCDRFMLQVAATEDSTLVDRTPRLHGKWVSKDCEVRSGPEFILRSYTFSKNNTFKLLQFYYDDESCVYPGYTISAVGSVSFRGSSNMIKTATDAEFTLSRVTVVPQTVKRAESMSRKVRGTCLQDTDEIWRPHKEYIVYYANGGEMAGDFGFDNFRDRRKRKIPREKVNEIDCLDAIGVNFNELLLMRTQTKPVDRKKNRELLLGDTKFQKDSRASVTPNGFQVPLLKINQSHDCSNCHVIAKGTHRSPPHLIEKPQLPLYLDGEWVSMGCENQGSFLMRRFSFDSRDQTWMAEYTFYMDPRCGTTAFTISSAGRYSSASYIRKCEKHKLNIPGTPFDYKVARMKVTLHAGHLAETFMQNCGDGPWIVGVAKEITATQGCAMLGLTVPMIEYQITKLEMDNKGTPLLFMGVQEIENRKKGPCQRPTSYQPPLAQCSSLPPLRHSTFNNQLHLTRVTSDAAFSSASVYLILTSVLTFIVKS